MAFVPDETEVVKYHQMQDSWYLSRIEESQIPLIITLILNV